MRKLFTSFRNPHSIGSAVPLTDDQIRRVAPSIFADAKHSSRSELYAYIPTSEVLAKLRVEGFQPFMACQTRVRDDAKRDHTRHMLRLRHASQVAAAEADEIILLNSHDGSSSYQMVAGSFRFACENGLVAGNVDSDIRIPHKGDVVERVVAGAHEVLEGLVRVVDEREAMKGVALNNGEQLAFARAALALRYGDGDGLPPPPISERAVLSARRSADSAPDLWTTFNRVQENLVRGGLQGRNAKGRAMSTRPVTGIDQGIKLNRALWVLADEMRKLRGG